MRDPHVVSLRYRLVLLDDGIKYQDPPPLNWDTSAYALRLENNIATVQMLSHFGSVEDAREAIEPQLRAWELDTGLRNGRSVFRLEFDNSKLIDRNPPPLGQAQIVGAIRVRIKAPGIFAREVIRRVYPHPPTRFKASPDVETMWSRFEGFREGKEPLAAMGYFCLTVVESRGGRKKRKRGRPESLSERSIALSAIANRSRCGDDCHDEVEGTSVGLRVGR